jgi:DNA-3-methyladenine glycosylase II
LLQNLRPVRRWHMKKILDKSLIKKAIRHLSSSDKALSALIGKHGPCTITPALDHPFHALASSIIGQQLSAHAAKAIKGRVFELMGTDRFTPEKISKVSFSQLRTAGLSKAKIEYLWRLASAARNGEIDLSSLMNLEDEEIISKLTAFSGIGRWTAEMFLIFGLGRPDVLSVNDAGLKRGLKITYKLLETPSEDEILSFGESWRPYRSVASWYLWRVVD